jgi:hypothetical protein
MERASSALTNRGWKSEHDDINVHDIVVSKISWFVVVEDGFNGNYLFLREMLSRPKKQPQTNFFDIDDDQRWAKMRVVCWRIHPLNMCPLMRPLQQELYTPWSTPLLPIVIFGRRRLPMTKRREFNTFN